MMEIRIPEGLSGRELYFVREVDSICVPDRFLLFAATAFSLSVIFFMALVLLGHCNTVVMKLRYCSVLSCEYCRNFGQSFSLSRQILNRAAQIFHQLTSQTRHYV